MTEQSSRTVVIDPRIAIVEREQQAMNRQTGIRTS